MAEQIEQIYQELAEKQNVVYMFDIVSQFNKLHEDSNKINGAYVREHYPKFKNLP